MTKYTKGVEDAQRLLSLREREKQDNPRKGGKPMPDPKKDRPFEPDVPIPGEGKDFEDDSSSSQEYDEDAGDDFEENVINPT
jgi:hypothetical protein